MDEVIEALSKKEAYGEVVERIELKQTHISYVFLTGNYVYKVKKPVNFGFLDFTTLEKRKFYCNEELRLNRRLCDDMYLGVVPINKSQKGIKIKGEGKTVEYAVKMKQMPQDAIMTEVLRRKEVKESEIDEIAKILSKFHAKAKTGGEIDEYGSIGQIKANWVQNFDQTRQLRGSLIDKDVFDSIETSVTSFMYLNLDLFERRVDEGKVRECHGDVHSGNIFILKNGKIYIFDAIEFNKAFSCSDVTAEVAFLAMDLEFNNRNDLATRFVNRYVEFSKDKGLIELLPFYKCYRAYVRAKVASFKLNDPHINGEEKEEAKELTKKYFNLAYKYAKEL